MVQLSAYSDERPGWGSLEPMSQVRHHMEHRWGTRVELHAPAELLTHGGQYMQASVRNASLSGAFVDVRQHLPLMSRVALSPLARPDRWLEGCVVRVESSGVALEWLDPGLQAVSILLSLRPESAAELLKPASSPSRHSSVTWLHPERARIQSARS
jgi:hypothetical protein